MSFFPWLKHLASSDKLTPSEQSLHLEPLEPRVLLSADFTAGTLDSFSSDLGPAFSQDPSEQQQLFNHFNPHPATLAKYSENHLSALNLESLGDLLGSLSSDENDGFIDLLPPVDARMEIVFIDASSADYQAFIDDLQSRDDTTQYEIFLLDADRDGIEQISQTLAGFSDVDGIHIVSHGVAGTVKLGNVWLDANNLADFQSEIISWGSHASKNADLLFYGCDLASNASGNLLLRSLAELSGMDIAASDDLTGAALFGGDWDLEVATGTVETEIAFSKALQSSWQHVLLPPTTSGIADVTITQGDADNVINLLTAFTDPDTNDSDLVYTITGNTNAGLFTTTSLNQAANTLTLDFADTYGTSDITVSASDGDLSVSTTFTVTVNPNATLWVGSLDDTTYSDTAGAGSWLKQDIVQIGGSSFATGNNSAGTISAIYTQPNAEDIDGIHYVTTNLTIGTVNSIDIKVGDVLLSLAGDKTLVNTSAIPIGASLDVDKEDVFIMRPDTVGDYSKVNYIMLIDQSKTGTSDVAALTLVEEATVLGNYYLQPGSLLTSSASNSVDLLKFGNLQTGAGGTSVRLIDGEELRDSSGDKMITEDISAIELIENDTILAGNTLKSGSLILSIKANDDNVLGKDGTNPNTTLSITKNDLFIASFVNAGVGTETLEGTATLLIDGSDLGLTENNESINALTLYAPLGGIANANPGLAADTYSAVDGKTLTVNSADGVLANDTDPDTGSNAGLKAALVTGPTKAATFTLNSNGSFVYAHNNSGTGTDTFTYATYDDKGGVTNNTVTINILTNSAAKLHVTTTGDVTSGGLSDTESWDATQIVEFGGPVFTLGNTTAGTFYPDFNLSGFSSNNVDVDAIHHVRTSLTIGMGGTAVTLNVGDLLLSTTGTTDLTSSNTLTGVNSSDVFVFRPNTAGDYSAGTFIKLLKDPEKDGSDITAITLVEETTVLGDTVLDAGTFLYAEDSQNIKHLVPNNLTTNNGTITVIVDGNEQRSGQDILPKVVTGLELIENDTTIGGKTLKSGTLLVSMEGDGTVLDGLVVDRQDIFSAVFTKTTRTEGATTATASLLFDGSDVNLSAPNEAIGSLSLEPSLVAVTNLNPTTAADAYLVTEAGTLNKDASAGVLSNDSDPDAESITATVKTAPAHASSFTLNADGSFNYVHDGSETTTDSFVYVASDGKGGVTSATVTITINPAPDETRLWLSTNAGTTTGAGSQTWEDNQILRLGDPGLVLGAATAGTYSTNFNIENFTQNADDTDIDAIHHVTKTLTIGTSNTVNVKYGDILLSVSNTVTLKNSNDAGTLTVNSGDVFIFRPDVAGDNSAGQFLKLLTNVNGDGTNITAITLVEATTTITTGLTVNSGDFLFVADDDDIKRLQTGNLNASPPGTVTTIIIGAVSLGDITGLELIESSTTIGGVTLSSGDLIVAQASKELLAPTAEAQDLFVLDYVAALLTSSILVDYSDIDTAGANLGNEEIDAISLQPAQVNSAPVTANNAVTIVENATHTFALSDFTFTDADSNVLINVTITSLESGGELKLSGADVTLNQAILRADIEAGNLTYTPNTNANGTGYDNIKFKVNDGFIDSTSSSTFTINVTANDPPSATNLTATKNYTEGDTGVALDDINVTDPDPTTQTITATLTLSDKDAGLLTTTGGGSYNATTGVWTATGNLATVNAALVAVSFTPNSDYDQDATITTQIRDQGNIGPSNGSISLNVTPVNDAPTATNLSTTINYNEGAATQAISDIVISDVDTDPTQSFTATLSLSDKDAGLLTTTGGGSYNATTGVWTASGNLATVNAALAAVSFTPSSNYDQDATITTQVRDQSNTGPTNGSISLNVTPANDAPTATNLSTTINYNEGAATQAIDDIVISDVDTDPTQTFNATLVLSDKDAGVLTTTGGGSYNATTGVWTASGNLATVNAALAAVSFTPSSNYDQDATITTQVRDQSNTGPTNGSISLNVTPANDAPTATNLSTTINYSEGAATQAIDDIVISDVDTDPTQSFTATLSLSDKDAGLLTTTGGGSYNATTGVWTASGNLATVNAALAAVSFTPNSDYDQNATITTQIRDQSNTGPTNGSISLNVTPANDAPTATNLSTTINYSEGAATQAIDDIVISDVDTDPTQTFNATLVLSDKDAGVLTTTGGGSYNATTGVWTASGNLATVNAALAAVSFTPNSDYDQDATITTQVRDQSNTGPSNGSITLDVLPVNDAPVTANSTVTGIEDTTLTFALADFAFTDVEPSDVLLSVKITTLPSSGFLTLNGVNISLNQDISRADLIAGNLKFTPAANQSGAGNDTFGFSVSDGIDDSFAAVMTININAINDAPTSTSGTVTAIEDTPYTFSVADFNYSDIDGDALNHVRINGLVDDGALTVSGVEVALNQIISATDIINGNLLFTPGANDSGAAYTSFNFVVNDGSLDAAAASTLTIDVTAVNDPPNAFNESISTPPNTTYIFTSTDFDFTDSDEGDTLSSISITSLETVGKLTLGGVDVILNQVINKTDIDSGLLRFEPIANATGNNYDSFGFALNDGSVTSSPAVMTININNNTRPTTSDSLISIAEDSTYAFTSADFNFSDVDAGDTLNSIEISRIPGDGELQLSGSEVVQGQIISKADLDAGNLTYVPTANNNGIAADSFDFRVLDAISESSSNATLTFDVTPVNDAPLGNLIIVGTIEVNEQLTANTTFISDVDGLGDLNLQWQRNGVDIADETNVSYTVTQIDIGALISLNVSYTDGDGTLETLTTLPLAVNAAGNQAPLSNGLAVVTVAEDSGQTTVTITDSFTDPDNDALFFTILSLNNNSLFSNVAIDANNNLVFSPADDASGSSELILSVSDSAGARVIETLTIVVSPVNDSPVGIIDLAVTDEDSSLDFETGRNVLFNDLDADGDSLTIVQVNNGSFTVTAGETIRGDEGGSFVLSADGVFSFEPGEDFQSLSAGETVDTQVTYTVVDTTGATATVALRVTVIGVNDATRPVSDFANTSANQILTVETPEGLLVNDLDIDTQEALTVVAVTNGNTTVEAGQAITGTAGGIFTVQSDGSYNFNPASDFILLQNGVVQTTTITYIVADASGERSSATLSVNIAGSLIPTSNGTTQIAEPSLSITTPPTDISPPDLSGEVEPETEPATTAPESEPESEQDPTDEPVDEDDGESEPGIETLLDDDLIDIETDPFSNPGISISGIDVVVSQLTSPTFQAENIGVGIIAELSEVSQIDIRGALGLIGTTDSLILINSPDYKRTLDQSRNESQELQQLTQDLKGGTLSVTAGVSIGYVIWLIRSGVIMSSVLSALPAWRLVDPLPILSNWSDSEDTEGESIEDIIQSAHGETGETAETEASKGIEEIPVVSSVNPERPVKNHEA